MSHESVAELARFIETNTPAVALVGAGLSTDSGIPDYRGLGRSPRVSVEHRSFIAHAYVRQRYWARSFAGWPRFANARPNLGHQTLATLESAGLLRGVITQNVDGLHQAAGSHRLVELHGSLSRVRCLSCGDFEARATLQERMATLNAGRAPAEITMAPDGDADLDAREIEGFVIPACMTCQGVLKPDVVFFGDNVPVAVTGEAWRLFDEARCLLILGTSLAVWSGLRFARRAASSKLPVVIINRGPTRGDDVATLRIDAPLGEVLPELARIVLATAKVTA